MRISWCHGGRRHVTLLASACALLIAISSCSKASNRTVGHEVAKRKETSMAEAGSYAASLNARANASKSQVEASALRRQAASIQHKMREKLHESGLGSQNVAMLDEAMQGHTKLYQFEGSYKVLVIPVQFADKKFEDPSFFSKGGDGKSPADVAIFGDAPSSLSTYYKHASLGKLHVSGQVAAPVTVEKDLITYGEAVTGNNDKDARKLVVDALLKVKGQVTDTSWWEQYDNWDLSDYDNDRNFHEPDGFLDAVVLIYAGKAQSSCQRSFDPEGLKPASSDVPQGPRHDATVECFNRIWPHRWSLSIASDDPLYSADGPEVEGIQRPSLNGLKVTDSIFAFDYNMQSEFSDLSTFVHEFGHSLSLPDVYAYAGANNTGGWDIMSGTTNLIGQEMSTFSKLSLGWTAPKVFKQGEKSSAYLGSWNFVPHDQREEFGSFEGPIRYDEFVEGDFYSYDVLSRTPEFGEPVFRSLAVVTDPTVELVKVVEFPEQLGTQALYSGRYDNESRGFALEIDVPSEGDATLSLDHIHAIETETNFDGPDAEIKVVTDFDIGSILIDGVVKEELRLISGDNNRDSLNETDSNCDAARVLALRTKKNSEEGLSAEEKEEFKTKKAACQKPSWIKKTFDLAEFRGKKVKFEIRLVTDAGYTEMGVVIDNVKLGEQVLADFEGAHAPNGQWILLGDQGQERKKYQQAYFFEYRDPYESFAAEGEPSSLNYDASLKSFGNQTYFTSLGGDPVQNFRAIDVGYQPGVLVWYYNSKFTRRDNGASVQDGKGYLLVLNAHNKELPLPGAFSEATLFDDKGAYRPDQEPLKTLVDQQKKAFVCFSHTTYSTYLEGVAPVCEKPELNDAMQKFTRDGKPLRYRREWFNDVLPQGRSVFEAVGEPFRNDEGIRSALATFRPKNAGSFSPFTVSHIRDGALIEDSVSSAAAAKFAPVSSFSDANNRLSEDARFKGDNVIVEKKGFSFTVASPASRIAQSYDVLNDTAANSFVARKPRAKVLLDWKK